MNENQKLRLIKHARSLIAQARKEKITLAAIGRLVGYSRVAISLLASGGYTGKNLKLATKIVALIPGKLKTPVPPPQKVRARKPRPRPSTLQLRDVYPAAHRALRKSVRRFGSWAHGLYYGLDAEEIERHLTGRVAAGGDMLADAIRQRGIPKFDDLFLQGAVAHATKEMLP